MTNLTNVKAVLFLATVVLAWLGPDAGWERRAAVPAIVLGQALVFWSLFVLALQHRSVRRFWGRAARPLTLLFAVGLMLLGGDAVFEGIRKAAAGWEWDRH